MLDNQIKSNNKNTHFSFVLIIFMLLHSLLITSCSNFLSSKNVAEDIKKIIAYNNAPECNVLFKSETQLGSFLTGETLILKVGFDSKIQFKVNKEDYLFCNLEAVSKSNPDESLVNYVTFTQKESDKDKGIYTINVKVTKQTSDLMIRPVCIAYPAVTSYFPSSREVQFANTPIVINFNMPMIADGEDISSIFNYNNISISASGVPLTEYFQAPVFNEDKTKLTLTPKAKEFKAYINRLQADFIEVQVLLKENITVKYQNNTFALKQNNNSNFLIKYKNEIDETPPQRIDFFVTRIPIEIKTAGTIKEDDKFILESFKTSYNTNFEYADKNKNNGTIYIYGKYSDQQSGVKSVTIGNSNYTSKNAEFLNDSNGNTSFCIKHILTEPEDNTLDCYVTNYLDYESNHVIFTAYHKTLDARQILVYNFDNDFYNQSRTEFNLDYYNSNRKIIKIPYDWDNDVAAESNPLVANDPFFKKYNSKLNNINYYDKFTIKYEYKDKDGIIKKGNFINDKENLIFFYEIENVENLNGLKIKVTVIDDVNNQDECEVVFPVASAVIIQKENTTTKINFEPIDIGQAKNSNNFDWEFFYTDQILLYEDNGVLKTMNSPDGRTLTPNINYKVIPVHIEPVSDRVLLYGDIGTEIYTTESTTTYIPDVILNGEPTFKQGSYEVASAQGGGLRDFRYYMDITVKISQNSWENFDYIYLENNDYYDNFKLYFENNEYELTFSVLNSDMYYRNTDFTIYGIKDTLRSQGVNCIIPKLTTNPDYKPSTISITKNINDKIFKIKLSDAESGPDYAYVENILNNGNYKYILNESNSYQVEVPFWELLETKNYRYAPRNPNYQNQYQTIFLAVTGFDKSGNLCHREFEFRVNSYDYYHYPSTPNTSHDKTYDLMFANGNSKKSMAISSNENVLVHTIVTTSPYSECKDWCIEEWEHYKKTLNEKTLLFSSTDHSQQRYDIPYDDIEVGECYCVIAWYADGKYEQSEVWQK